ncbi:MAG TPA: AraC family transcriptional regulator [Herpetosiphonaceae bacterium]|nr:AraC family transcriptional regulator [Herpetosiphonaceae bacterium]
MDTNQEQPGAWEHAHSAANREELVARITRMLPADGSAEPLPGLHFHRVSAPTEPLHSVTAPAFCVIAQGSKVVLLGNGHYRYDPANYLLTTAELPVISQVLEAAPARPYLSLRLDLPPTLVGSVMVEAGNPPPGSLPSVRALAVSSLDAGLLDVVVRLARLADAPRDARFLAPLLTRELIYRLLVGEQGGRLRQIAAIGGASHRIVGAIERIKRDFHQPLRIEALAQEVGMSVSGFHSHFKAVTAMSPGQYQKQLRLQEARRLLLGEHLDAASVGARVGYDDAAYFSREYKRLFGAPPMRDVARMRDAVSAGGNP